MADRLDLLTLADGITAAVDLDKKTSFDYADRLHHNIEKRGCSASKI